MLNVVRILVCTTAAIAALSIAGCAGSGPGLAPSASRATSGNTESGPTPAQRELAATVTNKPPPQAVATDPLTSNASYGGSLFTDPHLPCLAGMGPSEQKGSPTLTAARFIEGLGRGRFSHLDGFDRVAFLIGKNGFKQHISDYIDYLKRYTSEGFTGIRTAQEISEKFYGSKDYVTEARVSTAAVLFAGVEKQCYDKYVAEEQRRLDRATRLLREARGKPRTASSDANIHAYQAAVNAIADRIWQAQSYVRLVLIYYQQIQDRVDASVRERLRTSPQVTNAQANPAIQDIQRAVATTGASIKEKLTRLHQDGLLTTLPF